MPYASIGAGTGFASIAAVSIGRVRSIGNRSVEIPAQSSREQASSAAPSSEPTTSTGASATDEGTQNRTLNANTELRQLQQVDRQTRARQAMQRAAAGRFAGQARYTYTTGPDQRRYAVEGDTPIDLRPVPNDPQATVRKMRQVRRAAMATDPRAASRAIDVERAARREIAQGQGTTSESKPNLAQHPAETEPSSTGAETATRGEQRKDPIATARSPLQATDTDVTLARPFEFTGVQPDRPIARSGSKTTQAAVIGTETLAATGPAQPKLTGFGLSQYQRTETTQLRPHPP